MECKNRKYPWGGLAGTLLSALLILGCAGKETIQKDFPFEKWSAMAETATGHSPEPRPKGAELARALITGSVETGGELKHETIRELPTQLVSLKMRQADIKTVLRSLARVIDTNILVKNEIRGEITIDFKDVPWNQAFNSLLRTQGLTYAWEGDILRVMTLEDMETNLKRKTQEQGMQWVEPLLTVVIPIDYAIDWAKPGLLPSRPGEASMLVDAGKELKDNLESFLTRTKEDKPRGSVRVDVNSNSLIISAIKDDILKMIAIIEKIDKPAPQIQIKANIVETSKDTARNLGIQWGGMYSRKMGNDNLFVTPGGSAGSAAPPGSALSGAYTPTKGTAGMSGQGYGINFPVPDSAMSAAGGAASLGLLFGSIGGNILDVQLSALQKDGKLNILSSPSITTMNNRLAFTENGERIPFSTFDTSTYPPTRTVKFEDAVLRLEITPHVIDSRHLSMKIVVKKDEVDTSRTVDGNPFIIKKQTVTSLIVGDGETIVISGLTKQRGAKSDSGVPWMKDIPVLGWLFKGEGTSSSMEEVLIFITPKILAPPLVAAAPTGGGGPGGNPNAETAKRP